MMVRVLLLALFILLLLFPRLDMEEESVIFVSGETSGDAVGGGRGLDGNDATGRLVLVAPKFL